MKKICVLLLALVWAGEVWAGTCTVTYHFADELAPKTKKLTTGYILREKDDLQGNLNDLIGVVEVLQMISENLIKTRESVQPKICKDRDGEFAQYLFKSDGMLSFHLKSITEQGYQNLSGSNLPNISLIGLVEDIKDLHESLLSNALFSIPTLQSKQRRLGGIKAELQQILAKLPAQ